jgi:signal transduction histidine kinase
MHDDVRELDDLLEELLTFLRFDEPGEPFSPEEIDLGAAIDRAASKHAPFRPDVRVRAEIPPGFTLRAHPRYFPRVLENLVANAVRHANSQVRVRASSGPDGGPATITVDDDGPGIPPADRERVFEPFVRTDSSRDRRSGGTGLGLAIVRRIVRRHGGTVTAGEGDLGGARFTVVV